MLLLTFLTLSCAIFLLAWLLYEVVILLIIRKYKDVQEKRALKLTEELEESFIFWEKKRMVFIYFTPFIFAGLGFLLLRHIISVIIGFILGLVFPNLMVNIARRQRLKKFQSQLVDATMMLSSSLKAGLSFIQAIEVLCEEMPAPISQEFYLVLKENKWGISLEESLRRLRDRVPIEEVNLLVSSILIARESGGELTRVLSRLAETIRNNLKLKEKIATLTLQGRLQGLIMMVLPFAFAYFVYKQNPGHFDIMLETNLGRTFLVVALVLQIIGMILIQRISRMKV